MVRNPPNLFCYATKELSQDAVICWLIAWSGQSKDGSSEEDEKLRLCGLRFAKALLNHKRDEKDPIKLDRVDKVEIYQQEQGIDILARINRKHVLLIEDKIGTKDHSEQLSRYYGMVVEGRTKLGDVEQDYLYPVYLKTGNQSLADDQRIESETNFKVFNREDFLTVLNDCKGHNAILLDFQKSLLALDKQTNSYVEWARDSMRESWYAWEGFYRRLECGWADTNRWIWWGYVPNPSGGFLCFSWNSPDNGESELYLQIEARLESEMATEAKLCFKVSAKGKSNRQKQALKWGWHERVMRAGEGLVARPRVMRIGDTMTVAFWEEEWMAFDQDGKLDVPGTVKNLKQAEAVVNIAISPSS